MGIARGTDTHTPGDLLRGATRVGLVVLAYTVNRVRRRPQLETMGRVSETFLEGRGEIDRLGHDWWSVVLGDGQDRRQGDTLVAAVRVDSDT